MRVNDYNIGDMYGRVFPWKMSAVHFGFRRNKNDPNANVAAEKLPDPLPDSVDLGGYTFIKQPRRNSHDGDTLYRWRTRIEGILNRVDLRVFPVAKQFCKPDEWEAGLRYLMDVHGERYEKSKHKYTPIPIDTSSFLQHAHDIFNPPLKAEPW